MAMGFLSRIFGSQPSASDVREAATADLRLDAASDGDDLIEIEIVGESFRQDAIERIAGPKEPEGKQVPVGITLRCEPRNEHDRNAIRVEVFGQHVGFVDAKIAARVSPAMQHTCGGVLEGRGLVVGGWHDGDNEGSFGVRGWITSKDVVRLGLDEHETFVNPRSHEDQPLYPTLRAPSAYEERLTPSGPGSVEELPTEVAVTCEQHYQDVIAASRPSGCEQSSWPVLVGLAVAANPHARTGGRAVEVRIGDEVVGYFTAAMSERHAPTIESANERGRRATAAASVRHGKKGGVDLWRLHVGLRMPDSTDVTVVPTHLFTTRSITIHAIAKQMPSGNWRTRCGRSIPASEAHILCTTHPTGKLVDSGTNKVVAIHNYPKCEKCE